MKSNSRLPYANSMLNHPKAVFTYILSGNEFRLSINSSNIVIFEGTKRGYERTFHKERHKNKVYLNQS